MSAKNSFKFLHKQTRNFAYINRVNGLGLFQCWIRSVFEFFSLVLISNGYESVFASSIISTASWVMIFSGAVCGFISDKTNEPNMIVYICMGGCVLSFLILLNTVPSNFGINFWIDGNGACRILMALSAEAMRSENRSIGMGVFYGAGLVAVIRATDRWLVI